MLCNITIKGQGSIPINVWERLDATTLLKVQTGEALPNLSAYYKGLKITQNNKGFTIKNSLHKFSQTHNTGLFTLADCIQAINNLSNFLEVDLWQCSMPKFEFGVNIPLLHNPSIYLQQIQGFKSKSFNPFDTADRQQTLFFQTQDYKIKLYNKTLESTLNYNLLRVEIQRINPSHFLPQLKTSNDIVSANGFNILANELLKKFSQIQFLKQSSIPRKCNDYFLASYFQQNGIAIARKSICEKYGKKKGKYFAAKYIAITKSNNKQNIFQQEIQQQINNQLVQILGSIPNL